MTSVVLLVDKRDLGNYFLVFYLIILRVAIFFDMGRQIIISHKLSIKEIIQHSIMTIAEQLIWSIHNQLHNILRLFNVLPNFPFTTSETTGDYYLLTRYVRVASRVPKLLKTQDLRKLGNIRKVFKPHRMTAQCPFPLPK